MGYLSLTGKGMRTAVGVLIAVTLVGCASTGAKPVVQAAPQGPPPAMNRAAPGPSANAAYAWCLDAANRKTPSPAYTIYGGAFVDSYVRSCMVDLGADPAYTAVLLLR